MAERREMVLNAFTMNCVGHINHGLWTHPRDRSCDYTRLDHWTALARTLERGLFDAVFIADVLGVYDVYGGGIEVTAREAVQLPVNEPTLLVPAMAAATRHLGFGVTVNIANEHPYTFARRAATLDHLTDGRFGWNVVTGYLDSAARAVGEDGLAGHDSRYDRADDYLDLLYKLWEAGWDDGAIRRDKDARVYADPAKIHLVRHEGPFYRSDGYGLAEPSRQRTPVLFQAGTSGRGQLFAARHAECVFISAPDKPAARRAARALRDAAAAAGREPSDLKVIMGATVVAGASAAEARDKLADYVRHASPEAGLAHFGAGSGIDLAPYGLDEPISKAPTNAIQSTTGAAQARGLTKRQLLAELAIGGRYPLVVGDGPAVAAELASWMEDGEVDGFNLTRTVEPECWDDFVALVVPALQERGIHKSGYREGSLRHKLFGHGDRLPARHAGSAAARSAGVAR